MKALVAVLLVLVAGGCGFPRDMSGTLDRVSGGTLTVGITANRPWTGGPEEGAEARLVLDLARDLNATVRWREGSESELMAALKGRTVDLVVGGLTTDAPWLKAAALTRPYVSMRTVVAVPPGVAAPRDLDGATVAARAGSDEVGALRREGARVVEVDDVATVRDKPVAVGEWLLDGLGLTETDHELFSRDHVWATPLGENAWLVKVEHFLLDLSHDEVAALLAEQPS